MARPSHPPTRLKNDAQRPRGTFASLDQSWKTKWEAPVTMIGLLLVGGAFSLGHHFFYMSLDGRDVDSTTWSQQINTTIGTVFAFLVKASFVSAVAAGYIQIMWHELRSMFTEVSAIDSKFEAMGSLFALFDFTFIKRSKFSVGLASLTWLLPLAAIFTPGTLTVVPKQQEVGSSASLTNLNFTAAVPDDTRDTTASANRLAVMATAGFQILPAAAFEVNSTYSMNFTGPSLKCEKPSETAHGIIDSLFKAVAGSTGNASAPVLNTVYVGFSPYTPSTPVWPYDPGLVPLSNETDWTNFIDACITGPRSCQFTVPLINGAPCQGSSGGRCNTVDTSDALWLRLGNESLSCSIQRTNYRVSFDAFNPLTSLKDYAFTQEGVFNVTDDITIGYANLMQPLLNILQGGCYYAVSLCQKQNAQMTQCQTDISWIHSQARVLDTVLASLVTDMASKAFYDIWAAGNTFSPYGVTNPISAPPVTDASLKTMIQNRTMADLIEEMSRNMTLSAFSNADYRQADNFSSPITTRLSTTIYVYHSRNLLLSYAIAFGVSVLACIAGLVAYIASGFVSRNTSFSTVLATTRNATLDKLVAEHVLPPLTMDVVLMETRLRCGPLQTSETASATAVESFGMDGEVLGRRGYQKVSTT